MSSLLGFSGEAWLLLFACMAIIGVLILIGCGIAWLADRLVDRRTAATTPPAPAVIPLPHRRIPIDPDTRAARDARLDGVLAEMFRTGNTGWYVAARLYAYEAELSEYLELALELDENVAAAGPEGD